VEAVRQDSAQHCILTNNVAAELVSKSLIDLSMTESDDITGMMTSIKEV